MFIQFRFLVCLIVIYGINSDVISIKNRVHLIFKQLILQNNQFNEIHAKLQKAVRPNVHLKAAVNLVNLTATNVFTSSVSGLITKPNGEPLTKLVNNQNDLHSLGQLLTSKQSVLSKIRSLLSNLISKSSDINFDQSTSFVGNITISQLTSDETIVNTTTLYPPLDDLVTTQQPNVFISGSKIFHRPLTAPSIECDKFNGHNLADNIILARQSTPIRFNGPMRFRSLIVDNDLQTKYGVTGLNISNLIPLKSGDVTLQSNLIFKNNLIVTKGLDARLINGYDLTKLQRNVLTSDTHQVITNLTLIGDLKAPKVSQLVTINNRNFNQTLRSILTKKDNVHFKGVIIVNRSVCHVVDLNSPKINGYSLANDFLTTNTEQVIQGKKVFAKINANNLIIKGKLNDLPFPSSFVTLTGSEKIYSPVEMMNRIKINGDINSPGLAVRGWSRRGEPFTQLIRRNLNSARGGQNVVGTIYVNGPLKVNGLVNGINLRSLLMDSIHGRDSTAMVTGFKTFNYPVQVANCEFDSVNRIPVSEFVNCAKYGSDKIHSMLEFAAPVKVDNLIRPKGGMKDDLFDDLLYRRISLQHDGYIDKWIYFGFVDVDNLQVNGMVNGIRLESMVFKNGLENITAKKIFSQGATFHYVDAKNFNAAKLNARVLKQCSDQAKKKY